MPKTKAKLPLDLDLAPDPSADILAGVPISTPPMEAEARDELPSGPGWQFEPKWDGFRCLAFRRATMSRCAPSPASRWAATSRRWSEALAGAAGRPRSWSTASWSSRSAARLSFDALQMRLHPAESRIRKLARETPAIASSCSTAWSMPREGSLA